MKVFTAIAIIAGAIVVLEFAYIKLNTHDPAPAFPQEIVEGYLKVDAPYARPKR